MALDLSRLSSGEVGVSWDILEKNDGGVLQLVYAGLRICGTEDVGIDAGAVIEGQPAIVRPDYSRTLPSPSEQYADLQG